jgi:hypothetical protein
MNILIHGLSRILAGVDNFGHQLIPMFSKTFLPPTGVVLFGVVLPWAELAVGLLMILGLMTRYTYTADGCGHKQRALRCAVYAMVHTFWIPEIGHGSS